MFIIKCLRWTFGVYRVMTSYTILNNISVELYKTYLKFRKKAELFRHHDNIFIVMLPSRYFHFKRDHRKKHQYETVKSLTSSFSRGEVQNTLSSLTDWILHYIKSNIFIGMSLALGIMQSTHTCWSRAFLENVKKKLHCIVIVHTEGTFQ